MKKVLIVLVATLLCGATFALEKNLQDINQRIAPPSFRTMDGTWCSSPNVAIPDNVPTGVSDDLLITDSETIGTLTVDVQIEHTWTGDINAVLTNGTCSIQLWHRVGFASATGCCGCSGDDFDVTLDDAGGSSIEDSCGTGSSGGPGGTFTPGDPNGNGIWPTAMSDCAGQDTLGQWTLTVSDNYGADTGTLLGWCINNTTTGGDGGGDGGVVPATSTTGLIILAVLLMIGGSLFVMRRRNA